MVLLKGKVAVVTGASSGIGREMLLDASTYGERSTGSARLPGALVESLRFTL